MQHYENFAHVELRELREGEGFDFEPPRDRKSGSKGAKRRRLEYRVYVALNSVVEIAPTS
jgi:hypothetical protein